MKLLLEIWGSWLFFFVLCAGLVALVEKAPQLPGVRKERTLEEKLANPDPELLKIQGKEWIASEGSKTETSTSETSTEEWVPPKTRELSDTPAADSTDSAKKAESPDPGKVEEDVAKKKEEALELGVLERVKEVPPPNAEKKGDQ